MDRQRVSFTLGKRLRELREAHDLSHVELVKQLNEKYGISISRDSIMAYEIADESRAKADKLPNMGMRAESLYCLADFYGVSLDYLFGWTEKPVPDMDTREICDQTGLSFESVKVLKSQTYPNDFLLLLINNLICQGYSLQASVRTASRFWFQGELGDDAKSTEELWFEQMLCFMHQEDFIRTSEYVSPFAKIRAKDAGDFYRDRALREIEGIALKSIEEYKDIFSAAMNELREMPDELMTKMDFAKRLSLLAANSALKSVMGDKFKGVPSLNELESDIESIRTNSTGNSQIMEDE